MSISFSSFRRLLVRYSITLIMESREDADSVRVRIVDTLELLRFNFNFEGNLTRGSGVAGVVWVPSGDWYSYELMIRTC